MRFSDTYALPENKVVFPGSTAYGPVVIGVHEEFVGGRLVIGPVGAPALMDTVITRLFPT